MRIAISGSNGFVGKNILKHECFKNTFTFFSIKRSDFLEKKFLFQDCDFVLHLAGIAHDINNKSNSADYYLVNTQFTKDIFDAFLISEAKIFIFLSSVKAVADEAIELLSEDIIPNPVTHYGKSKLLAEKYILSKLVPHWKKIYILRPCMIHGPGNKGNLNLLYNFVSKGIPWPLGAFQNKRSFCSIDNLCFSIKELIERIDIPSGIYNISDNEPLSTNDLIHLIANSKNQKARIFKVPKYIIYIISKFGNLLHLPFNNERLKKLTENYIVSNKKLLSALGKELPLSSKDGLIKTLQSFNH